MPPPTGPDMYGRAVRERSELLKTKLDALVFAVSGNDVPEKVAACNGALSAVRSLKDLLSSRDVPAWLEPLENRLVAYLTQPEVQGAAHLLMSDLMKWMPLIRAERWQLDTAGERGIDFEAVYRNYFEQSRIPQLFDELVVGLEGIIASGEVDSIKIVRTLERLIATIRQNERGSYFSTRGTWEITVAIFRNVVWELASDSVLGPVVRGVRKTMEELDSEMEQLNRNTHAALREQASAELPMLEYTPRSLPPSTE